MIIFYLFLRIELIFGCYFIWLQNVFTKKENVTEEMVSPDELEIPEDPLDTTYQMTSPVMIDFENDDELWVRFFFCYFISSICISTSF